MRRGPATLDVVIIGGGVAGLAAAVQCALRGLDCVLVESALCGGLVVNVGEVHGYPAPGSFSGVELASALHAEASGLGVRTVFGTAEGIDPAPRGWTVTVPDGPLRTAAVVAATGATLAPLPVAGFERWWGKGVSQCAFCDGGLYRGQRVVVVGGGDAALQEALHLATLAEEVVIVHRGSRLGARRHYIAQAAECANVQFRWSHEVREILGTDGVDGVRLGHVERDDEALLACRAVFPFVGSVPRSALFAEHAEIDEASRLGVDGDLMTRTDGLYAVGAVRAGYPGALVDAVSDGARVARAILAAQ